MSGTATVIMIPADESKPVARETISTDLETAQKIVGGWLEELPSVISDGWIALGNEEAKLIDLPVNRRAHNILVVLAGHNPADYIRGNVFIAGVGDEGETIDAPSKLWEQVQGVPGVSAEA